MDLTGRKTIIWICRVLGSFLVAASLFQLTVFSPPNIDMVYSPQLKIIVGIGLVAIGCWVDSKKWRKGSIESLFLGTQFFAILVGLSSLAQVFGTLNSEAASAPSFTWRFAAPYVFAIISWCYFFGATKLRRFLWKDNT